MPHPLYDDPNEPKRDPDFWVCPKCLAVFDEDAGNTALGVCDPCDEYIDHAETGRSFPAELAWRDRLEAGE